MSVDLSRKKPECRQISRRPHRKSHTEFEVKRNLNALKIPKRDTHEHMLRRQPRKTLKDESMGMDFVNVSAKRVIPHTQKSAQLNKKRKQSIDNNRYDNKENLPPNGQQSTTSKRKTKSKVKVAPENTYFSLKQAVSSLQMEIQWLQQHTLTIEQQNQALYKEIQSVGSNEQVNQFMQQQTKKKLSQLQKLCFRNQKSLADIHNHINRQSHKTLSIQQQESTASIHQIKPKKSSKKQDAKVSCISLADSIRRKLIR